MTDQIDKSSPIPYYVQLKDLLIEQIKSNAFADGKLPSENDLAGKYEITVTTVRKVLAELQNSGKIYKVKGLGSFVQKPKLELDITKYLSFGRMIQEQGLDEQIKVIKRKIIDFDAKILNGFEAKNPSNKVINIDRIRSIDREPLAIERLFFNADLCGPMFEKAEDSQIYYFLVEDLEINFAHIDEYLEPICLNTRNAELLNVKAGTPALSITKISYNPQDVWLEYSKTTIRGDKCRYHVNLK